MEKTKSEKYANKNTKCTKSVNERLANIRLQDQLIKESLYNGNKMEVYPKLRQPKPSTLLKIKTHQKKTDGYSKDTQVVKNMPVPLHPGFPNKEQLQQTNASLSKGYKQREYQRNVLDSNMLSGDFDEAQPLTYNSQVCDESPKASINFTKDKIIQSLNYCEQHLVNVLRVKVRAHANGFFAEDLPVWYKKTFKKDLPFGWLELLQISKQFDVENIQNKIVLYAKETSDLKAIDVKAYTDKHVA